MCEHMSKAGRQNGKLKAPHRQLEAFGINARYVGDAIREAEELGLVDCSRNGLRVASTYALTWLPGHDGTSASDNWRAYRNPALRSLSAPKVKNLPCNGEAGLPCKGTADEANLPCKGTADEAESLPYKGKAPLRKDLTRADGISQKGRVGFRPSPAEPVVPSPGKLRLVGSGGRE
jgi:hypothetical protein